MITQSSSSYYSALAAAEDNLAPRKDIDRKSQQAKRQEQLRERYRKRDTAVITADR